MYFNKYFSSVGCIYKHLGGSMNNVKNFRHKIEHNLISINKENKQCLITGDLNIDGLDIKSNNEVENFFNMLLEHNFLPTITCPTRIVNNPELHISLIDHIISSQIVKHSNKIHSGNIYSDINDHLPNFIVVEKGSLKKSKHNRPMVRILGKKTKINITASQKCKPGCFLYVHLWTGCIMVWRCPSVRPSVRLSIEGIRNWRIFFQIWYTGVLRCPID